jgi:imidazolonepropionase-like amidohydrolase
MIAAMTMTKGALALVLAACAHPSPSPATAFIDVTLVPMDREHELAHQTVVVRDGRIAAVGPTAATAVPEGARTIDGRGKYLMPGLVDMHIHTFDTRALALFVSRGVTTVRVMWGGPAVLGVREEVRAGRPLLAPWIYSAGTILDGKPPIWPGSTAVVTAAEATLAVEAQAIAGYDFIKVYSRLEREAYDAIVAAARRAHLPIVGHVAAGVGLKHALESGQASIEHLEGYATFAQRDDSPLVRPTALRDRIMAYRTVDDAKLDDAIARTKAAGTWNCPTLVVLDRLGRMDQPETLARPENRFASPAFRAGWDPKKDFRLREWTPDTFEGARGGALWARALVKRLSDAGAGILAGTDVGNPWLVPGFSLHDELALLVRAGLTPYQALRAATPAPAAFLGAERELGAVAVGRRADLVLVDADPLADIANAARIDGVMLRGRWLPEADLDAERERIAAIYRGERSRLEGVPAPAVAAPLFQARFLDAEDDVVFGEDRVTVGRGADGGLRVAGVSDTDSNPPTSAELDLGPSGNGTRLHVASGAFEVTVERSAGRARLHTKVGTASFGGDWPIGDDEVLSGPTLAPDFVYLGRLAGLPIDGKLDIKTLYLKIFPEVELDRLVLHVVRRPDGERIVAGKKIPVRVYAADSALGPSQLALDAAGWPVASGAAVRAE